MIIGVFDWLAGIVSGFLSPAMNTIGTNILQCLDEGPRIIQTPLDLELNTPKPGIVRSTTETINYFDFTLIFQLSGSMIFIFACGKKISLCAKFNEKISWKFTRPHKPSNLVVKL